MLIFSDNSYQYLELIDVDNKFININDLYKSKVLDTAKLFSEYWSSDYCHVKYNNLYNLKDSLIIPIDTFMVFPHLGVLTSPFGPRWGKMHKGVDLSLSIGEKIKVPFGGRVRYARFNSGGYGNLVIIRHYNGLETYYAHLDHIDVRVNQDVKVGDIIGSGGNTGHSTGPHLHFEVRFMGNAIDPEVIFDFLTGKLRVNLLVLKKALFEYQANSLDDSIDPEQFQFETDPAAQKQQIIKDANSGRRKKNESGYSGNMEE
jgi:murein DD-endopeptidase MepM/ murein hydrolase activator NlpD